MPGIGYGGLWLLGEDLPEASNKQCSEIKQKLIGQRINKSLTGFKTTDQAIGFLECEINHCPNLDVCKSFLAKYKECSDIVERNGPMEYERDGPNNCAKQFSFLLKCVQIKKSETAES